VGQRSFGVEPCACLKAWDTEMVLEMQEEIEALKAEREDSRT
jgi:hypothetical protein